VVIITGTGQRTAESYNGVSGAAPLLRVDYSEGEPPTNRDPTASFTFSTTDLVADFTDTSTDPDGDPTIVSWAWDFADGNTSTSQNPSHTYAAAGTYSVSLTVTDDGGLTSTSTQDVTVTEPPPGPPVMLETRVASSSDDAEEDASGGVSLMSSDLELVFDGSDQAVGMRFNAVTIPPGATVTNASIQFQVDETHSVATSLTIEGEAVDNATAFSSANGNISSRSRTMSSASWSPPPWTTMGKAGPDQETPNIASVIQEIVNRPGWSSGNSLVIIITGTGQRTAESYNGVSSAAPLLRVDYSEGEPPPNQGPAASFTFSTTDLSADFTDTSTDPDGSVVSWAWAFGDGATSTAQHPSHTYAAAGTYSVSLTVTDNLGLNSTATQDVAVTDPPPAPIVLTATGIKENGQHKVDLIWSGVFGTVDIYRDNVVIATVGQDSYRDAIDQRGKATYVYQVCEAGSTTRCSNSATVQF
jgi:PKD repeat protein